MTAVVSVHAAEARHGLDRWPRVGMRRGVRPGSD